MKLFSVQRGKRHHKDAAIFGVDESNVQLWQKHKVAISKCEMSQKSSLAPRLDNFLKLMTQSSIFFKRDARLE
jgi:hypothetical protein